MVTVEDESGEERTLRRVVFFPVSVFDVSQTDVMEGHRTHAQRLVLDAMPKPGGTIDSW